MKWLLMTCLLLAACTDTWSGSGKPESTDLTGPISCGESACASGDLCVTIPSPILPDDDYDDTACWPVPSTCNVYDCNEEEDEDSCAQCVMDEWYRCAWVELEDRRLLCVTN